MPEPGKKYVWHTPSINFGPVFLQVVKPRRNRIPGSVHFECIGPEGRKYRKIIQGPLPPYFKEQDWTEEDVKRSIAELERGRKCANDAGMTPVVDEQ